MAAKELQFNEEARRALEAGVDKLANVIKVTLGPKGHRLKLPKLEPTGLYRWLNNMAWRLLELPMKI